MAFLDWLANLLAPSAPPAAAQAAPVEAKPVPEPEPATLSQPAVPARLPKISAPTAAEICEKCEPEPPALELLKPQHTPAQFLALLQERHLGVDMVKVLAHGLSDREGVVWAVLCALKIADKLPAVEAQALEAAQAWVKNPTAGRQAAAAAAAESAELQGPGAWAAQAAAWAKTDVPAPEQPSAEKSAVSAVSDDEASEKPEPPRLAPQAVSAAVLLSATILARPQYANLKLHMVQLATGGVDGLSVGGVSVSQIVGAGAPLQAPGMGGLAVRDAIVPQLPGAAGKVQAGIAAVQAAGGVGAAVAGSSVVSGAMSAASAMGAGGGAAGGGSVSQMAAAASAAAQGGVPALPNAAAHALSGGALSGVAMPHVPVPGMANVSLPHLSEPNLPHLQLPPPTVPPLAREFTFREQQPFIRIGLEIASGVVPPA